MAKKAGSRSGRRAGPGRGGPRGSRPCRACRRRRARSRARRRGAGRSGAAGRAADSPTATSDAGQDVQRQHAAVVASARYSSLRRKRAMRRNSGRSTSRSAAQMTSAPSAGSGTRRAPGQRKRVGRTAATATSEYAWRAHPSSRRWRSGCRCCSPGSRRRAGADVGRPEREQLLAVAEAVPVLGREGACRQDVVGVPDDGHAQRGQQQSRRSARPTPGTGGDGSAAGTSPTRSTDPPSTGQQRDRDARAHDGEQRRRRPGEQRLPASRKTSTVAASGRRGGLQRRPGGAGTRRRRGRTERRRPGRRSPWSSWPTTMRHAMPAM